MNSTPRRIRRPDRILSYFLLDWWPLTLVTVSGVLYNVGMVAGPYFEGQLAQRLYDVLEGRQRFSAILSLAGVYLAVILFVQVMRCFKRFYVRRFANNTARNMRHMLYNSLVHMPRERLEEEGLGPMMTKAVADVDACAEGMRKFTTEVFDTGVVLAAYLGLLFYYDWRLALLSGAFTPVAYLLAGRLGGRIAATNAGYRQSAGRLGTATMDRIGNALTYRVYGCEPNRDAAYEAHLTDYEQQAVAANLWEGALHPLYLIISMCGAVFILYFGAKNVVGTGWTAWDIAAFTTFLSCFAKMAAKSSKAAKLFNAVQKAKVSWARVQPLMQEYIEPDTATNIDFDRAVSLEVTDLSAGWPGGPQVLRGLSFSAHPGQIIGVTGPVASGKSALGKALIGELPYTGSIRIGGYELEELTPYERSGLLSYLGHQPELMSDTIAENIRMGEAGEIAPLLRAVRLEGEVAQMPQGPDTQVGSGGVRLSGGQQARLALARTLFCAKQVLVLDDPFSAVDRTTEEEIFAALSDLARDRVVLLISHRLALFPRLAGVLYLEDGVGVFSTHRQLLEDCPAYGQLYRAQSGADIEGIEEGGEEDGGD